MQKLRKILAVVVILAIWAIWGIIFYSIFSGIYHSDSERRTQVPVKHEIERATEVKGLENKFVFVKGVFLGGAGGGGLGAPMIICSSTQQFVDLIPEKEPIFTAFEFPVVEEVGVINDYNCIKKVYWAFIENRAGFIVYEDKYCHEGSIVERYTSEMIYFYRPKVSETIGFLILMAISAVVLVVVSFILFILIFPPPESSES